MPIQNPAGRPAHVPVQPGAADRFFDTAAHQVWALDRDTRAWLYLPDGAADLPVSTKPGALTWKQRCHAGELLCPYPACGVAFATARGGRRRHSFAHPAGVPDHSSAGARETWWHLNAKHAMAAWARTRFPGAGTVAMAFAGDFLVPAIESSIGAKVEYGAFPMPRDKIAASDLGGNAIVAAKDGKNTAAATKFLQFIVQEDQMRTFCEATGQLPTLTSLTTSKLDFAVRPDLMETFVQQATTLTPEQVKQVTVPQFAKINASLADELEKAFLGGRSPADTTAALAAAVTRAGQ